MLHVLRRSLAGALVVAAAVVLPSAVGAKETPPQQVANIGNVAAVQNGPSAPSVFTTTQAYHVVQIATYHWNDAKGSPPGRVGLKDRATGKVYGPYKAKGYPGQGGVPNAYWVATVSLDLKAGRYQYTDSQPATWSQNDESGHMGFAYLVATPAGELAWPDLPDALVSLASVANGCGGGVASTAQRFGDTSTFLNSNNPLGTRYTVNFREACNMHDAGYSGAKVHDSFAGGAIVDFLGWSQLKVDGKFLRDMRSLCDSQIPASAPVARADCRASGGKTSFGAMTRYNIVRQFGHIFFRGRPQLSGVWKSTADEAGPAVSISQNVRYVRATWTVGSGDTAQTGEFRGTLISRDQDSVVKGTVRMKNAEKTLQRPMSFTIYPY